jgi:hypothetical protein
LAVLDLVSANNRHAFAWLQPGGDHPERAHCRPDLHGTELRPIIGADDSDLIRSLLLIHCRLRHQQRSLNISGWRLNARILAGSQQISGVGKLAHDLNGSRLRVYLPIREDDSAGMRVRTPIGQGQLQRDS